MLEYNATPTRSRIWRGITTRPFFSTLLHESKNARGYEQTLHDRHN